ncbi:hypothetical protein B0A78_07975 [Flavobacterium columnare NBRC 100251 = ATCC 23463]|uniref:hypothetical protein n=1 Tax=Flavobacterium columnare TaxID=996 RepID=UPI000981380D|nr:hypothetical protein [Flavobacterium columnare]MBF6656237.1 hypothetical protein [Flavobacterium columnare]MBF6658892.1 hypothetical protein [Flavobacterium columnare]OOB82868.1 hypothetical protein BZL53_07895 [Flavobacterium columnare]PDS23991.1 hypothetical protein B0A78_07975 [Flavobacterium columnare NBRC 100251 = ATCC 23463]PTD14585.1 hypothetical protein C6N29_09145 [Flavobacterium columnare]
MAYKSIIGGKLIVTAKEGINHYAKEDIIINSNKTINLKGEEKGVSYGEPEVFKNDSENFDVSLSINKKQSTFVPLGILDFENNYENRFFVFDYSLKMTNLDSLNFQILNENGEQIYQVTNLPPIVITAQKTPKLFSKIKAETPPLNPIKPIKTFDIQKLMDDYLYPDLTHIGNYCILWDGFNNDEIYDSTWFDGKKLKAKITAKKGSTTKVQEIEFETTRKEVDWVDVKIDKKTKRIDVTLRVNLKDGGANGLDCKQVLKGMRDNTHWVTECPWDDIPTNVIQPNKPIIKQRTRSFKDLEKLALDGLNYHWGRNKNHTVGNDVKINGESFEVYVKSQNCNNKALNEVDLVFNTNGGWDRSGNPGVLAKISYNVGYIEYSNGWGYQITNNEDSEFKETAAHEIGHSILKDYGGVTYSWQHKGTSYLLLQDKKPTPDNSRIEIFFQNSIHIDASPNTLGEYYPTSGEIDLMKYYHSLDPNNKLVSRPDSKRTIAAEKDVLSLIWLTKLKFL